LKDFFDSICHSVQNMIFVVVSFLWLVSIFNFGELAFEYLASQPSMWEKP
jgi:hypothetical protein